MEVIAAEGGAGEGDAQMTDAQPAPAPIVAANAEPAPEAAAAGGQVTSGAALGGAGDADAGVAPTSTAATGAAGDRAADGVASSEVDKAAKMRAKAIQIVCKYAGGDNASDAAIVARAEAELDGVVAANGGDILSQECKVADKDFLKQRKAEYEARTAQ